MYAYIHSTMSNLMQFHDDLCYDYLYAKNDKNSHDFSKALMHVLVDDRWKKAWKKVE